MRTINIKEMVIDHWCACAWASPWKTRCACAFASHNILTMQCTCAVCQGPGLDTIEALG